MPTPGVVEHLLQEMTHDDHLGDHLGESFEHRDDRLSRQKRIGNHLMIPRHVRVVAARITHTIM